jgi:hypothetical protein
MHNLTSSYNNNNETRPLPSDFTPGPYDVICAKGKDAKNHSGNLYYRSLVTKAMGSYSNARNRYEKTLIVSSVVEQVRDRSPHGGFVKQSPNGLWYEVGDHLAREKVGQNLRDGLSKQYKSSTKSKRRRREKISAELVCDVETMIQSNSFVSKQIKDLQARMKKNGDSVPEIYLTQIFTESNLEILEAFKQDLSLLQEFKRAEESRKEAQRPE